MSSIIFLLFGLFFGPHALASPSTRGQVIEVYDGDTVTLASGDKVRLRWVNAPEIQPAEAYAIEAREAARTLVLNQTVALILGETARDSYGRLIAGIKVEETDLSMHLASLGLAHVFIIPPDATDLSPLLEAQAQARAARRGIWSDPRYQGSLHFTSFHANAPGDDRQNVNGEYLRVCNISNQPVDVQGYRVTDLHGNAWELPQMIVPPGHTFKLHSGRGENQLDPFSQLTIYLGSSYPIWNNKRDRATLYDRFGEVIDTRLHEVQD